MSNTSEQGRLENQGYAEQGHLDEPIAAIDRLRAFEDRHFGSDAVRINGQIERGHGSMFNELDPKHRREHAAIENLIAAEKKLGEADGALSAAQSYHDDAKAAVEKFQSEIVEA